HGHHPPRGCPPIANSCFLEPQLLSLPANRATQVLELALDEVVDRVASGTEVVAYPLLDLLARYALPGIAAPVPGEARAPSRDACASAGRPPDRQRRPLSGRSAPQQQRRSGADRRAQQGGREQVVLCVVTVSVV